MRAEHFYVDPSALARLYIHQQGSREIGSREVKTPGDVERYPPRTH